MFPLLPIMVPSESDQYHLRASKIIFRTLNVLQVVAYSKNPLLPNPPTTTILLIIILKPSIFQFPRPHNMLRLIIILFIKLFLSPFPRFQFPCGSPSSPRIVFRWNIIYGTIPHGFASGLIEVVDFSLGSFVLRPGGL